MKVLVTGVAGQLGHDVMNELCQTRPRGCWLGSGSRIQRNCRRQCRKMPYVSMDITDAAAVEMVLQEVKPDAVVHCARHGLHRGFKLRMTIRWTRFRSIMPAARRTSQKVCQKLDCKMVYLSTDYVFDGQGTKPVGSGLQNLPAVKRLRTDEAGRRACSFGDPGQVFYRPDCMGVRRQRQELHQDDVECRQDT